MADEISQIAARMREAAESVTDKGPWRADYSANEFSETFFVRPVGVRVEPEQRVRISKSTTLADEFESGPARREGPAQRAAEYIAICSPASILAILDALAAAEKARDEAVARADAMQRDRAALSDALHGTPCAEIRWTAERDALAELLRRADTTMEVAERLIDYFSNNRTSFSGSGTPANCRKDIAALRAEIEAALTPRPSPTA